LRVAPRLLAQLRLQLAGRVVSGDALYCQQALCRQVRAAGAHDLFAVKANQPDLLDDVSLLFRDPPPGERFLTAQTVTKHGGRLEVRQAQASAVLSGYLQTTGWPDVGLVLAVQRWVSWPNSPQRLARHEMRSFLSSLPATTPAEALLRLVRTHWHSENRLHWPRDVPLGEDACRVRSGHAPQVLGLLRAHRVPNLAAALRTHAWSDPTTLLRRFGPALT
jgi:predicted transposase YbfD/YdcC